METKERDETAWDCIIHSNSNIDQRDFRPFTIELREGTKITPEFDEWMRTHDGKYLGGLRWEVPFDKYYQMFDFCKMFPNVRDSWGPMRMEGKDERYK